MKVVYIKQENFTDRVNHKVYAVEDGSCIVVSAAIVASFNSTLETYIFPSNLEGEIIRYSELPGSFQGELNHDKALSIGGYIVCNEDWGWLKMKDYQIIENGCYRISDYNLYTDGDFRLKYVNECNVFYLYDIDTGEKLGYGIPSFYQDLINKEKMRKLTDDELMIRDIIK